MENFTPGQLLALAIGMLLAAAGAVNTVGSALEKIAKARKAAQAPNEEQNRQLHELNEWRREIEEWRREVGRKLSSDHQELREIRDGLSASCQVQLALLDHALHGNNVKQMQDARDVLYNYMTHPDKRKE